ncbi:phosphoenolpyruvate--protein phosphotransferase [candidate division GN15 bacterium]|uniref:Phosphoenolpyruvate-protein phosphotransferase n=1 Tax=candidate division GN15 bacterium TaxID=2072418 RepID=A0A855WZY4_9BACT|nr:MAG: phosphoenolpyruvate--protein phosphotransferase [candidate division GN15 bacterium]
MVTGPTQRRQIKGVGVSPGIATGVVRILRAGDLRVPEIQIAPARISHEIDALDQAIAVTVAELRRLRDAAARKMASAVVKIFDAQLLIAGDYEFLKQVKDEIASQRRNAAFVYSVMVDKTVLPLQKSADPYLKQMVPDIQAVARRILSHLSQPGAESEIEPMLTDVVLVAQNFSPGEILAFRNRQAAGFLSGEGGKNSHMALIARSLMAPMIVCEACWLNVSEGRRIILDGTSGLVIINPTDVEWAEYQRLKKRQGPATIVRLSKLERIPPVTLDGESVEVAANLELPGPVDEILAQKRIPVGLYRTEFLYLQSDAFPDESAQFDYYSRIAETFAPTTVVLRTFDIGSDKMRVGDSFGHEDNPALGWRGIRSMLEMPDVFKAQMRAMLRASTKKNLQIMLPMISDLSEYDRAQKLIAQVKLGLRRDGEPFDEHIKIGIMVEVPSAALMADLLASRVDFISIGTNDLTQYTLSADRANARVAGLYSTYHPSVLQLIKITVDACKKHGKPVSICGEIAGDQLALPLFVGMGVGQLSMNPAKIYDTCRLVKQIDSNLVKLLVGAVMASSSTGAVTRKLENFREALDKS